MPVSRPAKAAPAPETSPRVRRRRAAPAVFQPPITISHPDLLVAGRDVAFRETLYLMVLAFSQLETCREAFGRHMGLTGSQFAVVMGVAYQQGTSGITIRALADYIQLASTHVTTEVGALIRKGLLVKRPNEEDRRSVLVSLTPAGEAAVIDVVPFLRRVNNLLFEDISSKDLAQMRQILTKLSLNGELALAELRRSERLRAG